VVVVSVLVVAALGVLTALGARRRGAGLPLVALAGSAFPVTWTVWYLRDQRPYRRTMT
jgi:hypothetical protein